MKPANLSIRSFVLLLVLAPLFVTIAGCSRDAADLPPADRPIPAMLPGDERAAMRELPLEGARNFRDLGGYPAANNRVTRWGVLYRSAKLSDLSADDQAYLQRLQLQSIVDFRSALETADEPDKLGPVLQQHYLALPIAVSEADTKRLMEKIEAGSLTAQESKQFLVSANRHFVDEYSAQYSNWLHSLLDENNTPMVFHCSEGKDRTGFGAAILLLAVGVDRSDVMRDYLASNQYLLASVDKRMTMMKWMSLFQLDTDAIRPVFLVERQYLESAFARIDERYGSFENYLRTGLDIDPQEQQRLVQLFTRER